MMEFLAGIWTDLLNLASDLWEDFGLMVKCMAAGGMSLLVIIFASTLNKKK